MRTITLSDEFYAAAEKTVMQLNATINSLEENRKSMERLHYRLFKEPLPSLPSQKSSEVRETSEG